jgi:hypothetical protein
MHGSLPPGRRTCRSDSRGCRWKRSKFGARQHRRSRFEDILRTVWARVGDAAPRASRQRWRSERARVEPPLELLGRKRKLGTWLYLPQPNPDAGLAERTPRVPGLPNRTLHRFRVSRVHPSTGARRGIAQRTLQRLVPVERTTKPLPLVFVGASGVIAERSPRRRFSLGR